MMPPDEPLDPLGLDRTIARAAVQARRFRRLLRVDPEQAAGDSWFVFDRAATTRTTFLRVSSFPSTDPLREPLRRWVFSLALTRIAQPALVRVAAARHTATLVLERPSAGWFSVRDLLARVLDEKIPEKRTLWMEGLFQGGRSVRAVERQLAEAVREIESRLGLESEPTDPTSGEPPLWMPYARGAMVSLATEILSVTEDLAGELFCPCSHLGDRIAQLVARDVPGVWPASIGTRWLDEIFGQTPLLEGLDLDTGPLVRPLGASSLVRTFARFGAAYARAASAKQLPWSIARDPTEAHPLRRGALFGSLIADPAFLRANLGFSRDTARGAARKVAVTLLGAARLEAARCLLDFAIAAPSDVETAMEQAWRTPYPRPLSAVLPRPCRLAPLRLAAIVMAVADRRTLVNEFDEDWFRNPRGLHRLRELDAMPPPLRVESELFHESAHDFAEWIASLSG